MKKLLIVSLSVLAFFGFGCGNATGPSLSDRLTDKIVDRVISNLNEPAAPREEPVPAAVTSTGNLEVDLPKTYAAMRKALQEKNLDAYLATSYTSLSKSQLAAQWSISSRVMLTAFPDLSGGQLFATDKQGAVAGFYVQTPGPNSDTLRLNFVKFIRSGDGWKVSGYYGVNLPDEHDEDTNSQTMQAEIKSNPKMWLKPSNQ